ncbi:AraC family transcriptional regulator [Amycolatopsis rhabdoformis]|uniref:AraC family transcriptional regulator n=1 Tax=Amycolatopsis rhabdoformis TaxID=1448059 RepID=A0ABZ1I6H1_9PSEU|nr:AraC family transcriptional regulator [Amycolatopsis rhabdoformis]WSE29915.1 AraC family transcriptional regulator [Amycolatopsis rhabdoformis]
MVKNGHPEIATLPYRADVGVPPGVEVFDFRRLVARAAGHGVDPYHVRRPEFHKLIAVRAGSLRCSVDFTDYELGPGGWLWIRPGQVHRYDSELRGVRGRLVLFVPGFLGGATAEIAGVDRAGRRLTPVSADVGTDTLWRVLELLEHEYAGWRDRPSDAQLEVLRNLLAVLVVRLAERGSEDRPAERVSETFTRFQAAVEQGFGRTHRVEDFAGQLGYSVRTLTRATQTAVGFGAKRFIDERVLLEAKRLLVHTDKPVAAVARQLGFPGAGVFTKFFRQRTEQTPMEFRVHSGSADFGSSSGTPASP